MFSKCVFFSCLGVFVLGGNFLGCFSKSPGKPLSALEIMRGKGECLICHSVDGKKGKVGPGFRGLFGSKITVITDGKERAILVDETYIRKSILNPSADITKTYPNNMKSYKDILTKKEIDKLINYIKKLK